MPDPAISDCLIKKFGDMQFLSLIPCPAHQPMKEIEINMIGVETFELVGE